MSSIRDASSIRLITVHKEKKVCFFPRSFSDVKNPLIKNNKCLKELYSLSYRSNTCMKYVQYDQGCAVQVRHIFNMREDVRHESGTSSVPARMCSTSQADRQYKQGCVVQASKSSSFGTGGLLKILSNE